PLSHSFPLPFLLHHTPPPDLYTLSLHDALPISVEPGVVRIAGDDPYDARIDEPRRRDAAEHVQRRGRPYCEVGPGARADARCRRDRKSTRLNSSHVAISYAVFCL